VNDRIEGPLPPAASCLRELGFGLVRTRKFELTITMSSSVVGQRNSSPADHIVYSGHADVSERYR
jgi:hypothetical protein